MTMLRPRPLPTVPAETARIARAAFPKGHPYLRLADELGELFTDEAFAALFPARGKPALAPWRLALATILQFAEGLSDRQAADAVRARLDWKYVLRLELTDPGFDASVLCEFRGRLVAGEAEQLLLDALLGWSRERGLLKARGQQRTDSTHVLAAVRARNRLEVVGETLRHALDSLSVAAPDWLRTRTMPEWGERYGRRVEDARLPKGQAAREALAVSIGGDGHALLAALYAPGEPAWLREVPAVETLRRVWVQQFRLDEGAVRWRASGALPPAAVFIGSPYDGDAHYARKDTTSWVGYKLRVTETCEVDQPQLSTHVETTSAPVVDLDAVPPIHRALRERDLLPRLHLADSGYLDALQLVASREEFGVELLGPSRRDYHWRERTGYAIEHFRIDWERQRATCPEGRTLTAGVTRSSQSSLPPKIAGRARAAHAAAAPAPSIPDA
jgi:transposase